MARAENLQLVTTEKDVVRFDPGSPAHRELARMSAVVPIVATFSDVDTTAMRNWLSAILQHHTA